MKIELVPVFLVGYLSLFGIYLSVFCGKEFFLVALMYGVCAFFLSKLSNMVRWVTIVMLFVHIVLNAYTINLLYGTQSDSQAATGVFLLPFNETRFFLEVGSSTAAAVLALGLLFHPAVSKRFKIKNA